MTIKERLAALRVAMKSEGVDALIIPANDPHQSEYVAEHWKVRPYFSGFTGSAGLLVVLADYAALWTDSRYFLQAATELEGTGIVLHKQQVQHAPEHVEWLCNLFDLSATERLQIASLWVAAFLSNPHNGDQDKQWPLPRFFAHAI